MTIIYVIFYLSLNLDDLSLRIYSSPIYSKTRIKIWIIITSDGENGILMQQYSRIHCTEISFSRMFQTDMRKSDTFSENAQTCGELKSDTFAKISRI